MTAYKVLIDNKILHRNIKPQNILLVRSDKLEVKLCDFGITGKNSLNDKVYVAPEIFDKTGTFNHTTDIRSICAVMHFMITGKPPTLEQKKINRLLMKVDRGR